MKSLETFKNDPHKSSSLPQGISLEPVGDERSSKFPVFVDPESGEKFFNKMESGEERYGVRVEQFIILLTKGIFHTSDMIEKDGGLYSREISIENTQIPENGEFAAELFLCSYLFDDYDKFLMRDYNDSHTNNTHHNLVLNQEGKFTHYDYGEAFQGRSQNIFKYPQSENELVKNIKKGLNYVNRYNKPYPNWIKRTRFQKIFGIKDRSVAAEKQILVKADEVLRNIDDTKFFNAIINKSKMDQVLDIKNSASKFRFLPEGTALERVENFRLQLRNRLEMLIAALKKDN